RLRRERYGRPRLRRRARLSWSAEWAVQKGSRGIPYRSDGNYHGEEIWSSSVPISDEAVNAGTWQTAALAQIVQQMSDLRARYDYYPKENV
ncbi:hypothetical protein, partial [Planotetraspora phitsanulokensis]